jgi:hypothetical protein
MGKMKNINISNTAIKTAITQLTSLTDADLFSGNSVTPPNKLDEFLKRPAAKSFGPVYAATLRALEANSPNFQYIDILDAMMACGQNVPKKIRCHSPFCPRCREERRKEASARALKLFGSAPHSRLAFLTVLISADKNLEDVPTVLDQFRKKLQNTCRNICPRVKIMGFFEIDHKLRKLVEKRSHTSVALAGIGYDINDYSLPDEFWLPHYHAIVDVGDYSRERIREILAKAFPGSHRVRLQPLRQAQTVEEALTQITGYMLKFKLQYADNIFTSDPKSNLKAKYGSKYNPQRICDIIDFTQNNQNFKMYKCDYGTSMIS